MKTYKQVLRQIEKESDEILERTKNIKTMLDRLYPSSEFSSHVISQEEKYYQAERMLLDLIDLNIQIEIVEEELMKRTPRTPSGLRMRD